MEEGTENLVTVQDDGVFLAQFDDLSLQLCREICAGRVTWIVEHEQLRLAWLDEILQMLQVQFPILVWVETQIGNVTTYRLWLLDTWSIDGILANHMVAWFE